MRYLYFLLLLVCQAFTYVLYAQTPTQTVRGQVLDRDSRRPLAGATLTVEGTNPVLGTYSDSEGRFVLKGVPLGRHTLLCRLAGYARHVEELVVNSAQELETDILLSEEIGESTADEVLITARDYPGKAVNDLSVVSTRSFSAEETGRIPAAANDPGRMALTYPGVQRGGDDSENDIIVRGNSSFGMLWRLEGIDIPNPNHFARPGTSGGGITVFSAQLLDNSDFSTGAMAAEYGNAISAAMDVHFRKGNMQRREYRARLNLIGIDLSAEGPLAKGRSSYLVNYRYSTLGLLNKMGFYLVGERVSNDFQDLSFNLAFNSKNGKNFYTVFGMAGPSLEHYSPVENPLERDSTRSNHREDRYQGSNMAAVGATWVHLLDEKSHLKAVVAVMAGEVFRRFDTLNLSNERFRYNTERYLDRRISASVYYNRKFSARTKLKAGVFAHQIFYSFFRESFPRSATSDINDIQISVDGAGNTQQAQAFAQISHALSEKLSLNAGLHYLYLFLNGTSSLEPRASLQYKPNSRQTLGLGYGLHGQALPLGAYFVRLTDEQGNVSTPNRDLKMIRSHHLVLSYNWIVAKNIRITAELYGQRLLNVPVSSEAGSTFWMLNNQSGLSEFPLLSQGKGLNYGADLALEKFFTGGFYFLITGSRYETKYELPDGRIFNTRFASRYTSTYTLGKEFTFRKGSILQIGGRVLLSGGFRYTPPDEARSAAEGRYISDENRAWEGQVPAYVRLDTRVSYRRNRPGYTSLISLDIQNATNHANPSGVGYDPKTGRIYYNNHPGGLIPVLGFEVNW